MAFYTLLVSDVATRVKRQFGDEAGVQIVDNDILRWVNDCAQTIIDRNHDALYASAFANTVANQGTYTTTDIFAGNAAVLHHYRSISYRRTTSEAYYRLKYYSPQEFDLMGVDWQRGPQRGDPIAYTVVGDVINVYPTPDISVTNGFQVFYNYRPSTVTATSDGLPLSANYHPIFTIYCLWQAYMLDEDWAAAQLMEQRFERELRNLRFTNEGSNRGEWDLYGTITESPGDAW